MDGYRRPRAPHSWRLRAPGLAARAAGGTNMFPALRSVPVLADVVALARLLRHLHQ